MFSWLKRRAGLGIRQMRAGWWRSPLSVVVISLGIATLAAACSSNEDSSDVADSVPESDSADAADGDRLDGYAASFDPSAASELYRFVEGRVELVGAITANGMGVQLTDLAVAADGTMYGATFSELLAIDPTTAKAVTIGAFTSGSVNALALLPDGQLLAADLGGKVSLVDPSTAEQTALLSYPAGLTSSGDLIAMPDGTVYATATDDTDYLMAIDVSAGTAELISANLPADIYGLMVSGNGDLYGLTFTSASGLCSQGEMIRIDPAADSYEAKGCLAFKPGGAASYHPPTTSR